MTTEQITSVFQKHDTYIKSLKMIPLAPFITNIDTVRTENIIPMYFGQTRSWATSLPPMWSIQLVFKCLTPGSSNSWNDKSRWGTMFTPLNPKSIHSSTLSIPSRPNISRMRCRYRQIESLKINKSNQQ